MFHFNFFRGSVAAYTPKGVCMPRHGSAWQYRGKVPRSGKVFLSVLWRVHGKVPRQCHAFCHARCHGKVPRSFGMVEYCLENLLGSIQKVNRVGRAGRPFWGFCHGVPRKCHGVRIRP